MAQGSLPADFAKAFTPTNGVTLDMKSTQAGDQFPRAFIVDIDGTLGIVTAGGDVAVIPVKVGAVYPIVCREFSSTGTSGPTSVIGLL